ncbi:MAG: hypothetical protein CMH62_02210 [Nanoarchaeota archaeon]|nr:hypothetical protein [Nanoarchaeota archaeon]|tara:strand:+ start:1045 stop:3141 length:2097 start_codon:yes stop_codon:yes gene_type:complete
MAKKKEIDDILEKYRKKLDGNYDVEGFSRQYQKFKDERVKKNLTFYEKSCNFCEKLLKVKVDKKKRSKLLESISRTELKITPEGANSFAFFIGAFFILIGALVFFLSLIFGSFSLFVPMIFIILGIVFIKLFLERPNRLANRLRLKAGNQMVLCILYIVMFMRHTSNLEHAVKFAAQNINDPLSGDLKKVIWDVENGKYSTIRESLDVYLESWRDYNSDFVNSFHLIESSLFEPSEDRRIEILERGLDSMLEGTHERMLHYAQDLKNPVTNLYMLGIILPVLGLIILPLVGAFIGVKWYWIAFFYNLILPVLVYLLGLNILEKRPSGEGEATDVDKSFNKYKSVDVFGIKLNPLFIAIPLFLLIMFIGLSPILLRFFGLNDFFGYRAQGDELFGPFSLISLLLSLGIPLAMALGLSIYYKLKTKNLVAIRKNAKDLEREFSGSLFQLGNRIEDGLPGEIAFSKVAETTRGTATGDFFNIVSYNIRNLGMSIKDSIFNPKIGAIVKYPSKVIKSSMEVLLESSRKGPQVAAHSLISVSNYMTNVHKVNERLKDLLADVISSLRGQINFLTPIIAGIVVGIGNTITSVVVGLGPALSASGGGGEAAFGINTSILQDLFPLSKIIPPYFFQVIVGVYLVQITIIMTILASYIENGVDKLDQEYSLGKNLLKSVSFYILITFVVTIMLFFMARGVLDISGNF